MTMKNKPIEEGAIAQFDFTISEKDMKSFLDISGDNNAMHWDPSLATSRGLKSPAVYGGLIVAQISRLIGKELPGSGTLWHSLSVDFVDPLYVNQKATIKGVVTYSSTDLRLFRMSVDVTSESKTIAKAKVQGGY